MYHRLLLLHIMIYMSCYDSLAQSFRNDTIMVGMMDEISRCHTLMKKIHCFHLIILVLRQRLKNYWNSICQRHYKAGYNKNSNGSCELRYGTFDLDHGNYSLKIVVAAMEVCGFLKIRIIGISENLCGDPLNISMPNIRRYIIKRCN